MCSHHIQTKVSTWTSTPPQLPKLDKVADYERDSLSLWLISELASNLPLQHTSPLVMAPLKIVHDSILLSSAQTHSDKVNLQVPFWGTPERHHGSSTCSVSIEMSYSKLLSSSNRMAIFLKIIISPSTCSQVSSPLTHVEPTTMPGTGRHSINTCWLNKGV